MGENPALSAVIADKIIAFLKDIIWPIVLVTSIIIFRNALSQLLKRISFDFSFGGAKGRLKATLEIFQFLLILIWKNYHG